jgi:predicted O-linked N-acetylglucosamine transferase (SPINDLY family)
VLRLPCYQPSFRSRAVAPQTPSRAEVGLPEDAMVFCCFNGAHKINRFTFERWLKIVSSVPGSVLWLLGSNDVTNERLRSYAAEHGVAKERLVFAQKLANPYHLARYALADLFLDTTPYGAHTTASDALWSGVPVLTYSGRGFASRVCGSLVRAAGLPELVCESAQDFVERAVSFGLARATLEPLRARLREGRSTCTLFDTPFLVKQLEGLYRQMWNEHESGRLPQPDLRNLDAYLVIGCTFEPDVAEAQTFTDLDGIWLEKLKQRHARRPLEPDARLITQAVTDAWTPSR